MSIDSFCHFFSYIGLKATFRLLPWMLLLGIMGVASPVLSFQSNCPVGSIYYQSNPVLCAGGSVTLGASTGTGYTYQWYRNTTPIAGATASTYTTSQEGSFVVAVTANGCTIAFGPLSVSYIQAAISPSVPQSLCSGGSLVLTGSGSGAPTGGSYTFQYFWMKDGAALGNGASMPAAYTVTQPGTYYVRVMLNGCFVSSSSVVVTTQSTPPTISISAPASSFCAGSSLTLSATGSGTYQWYKDDVALSGATASTYSATAAGVYHCVLNPSNCLATSNKLTLTTGLTAGSTVSFGAQSSPNICPGGSVVINGTAGSSFTNQWQKDGVNIPGATGSTYTATQAGSYRVVFTNNGCQTIVGSITVSIAPASAFVASPTGPLSICSGGSATLSVPTGSSSYQWRKDGAAISGATSTTYLATAAGSYSCLISNNGCSQLSNTVTVTNFVVAAPEAYSNVTMAALPNVSLTASSCYSGCAGSGYESWRGKLFDQSPVANWSAQTNDANQYLQIDLGIVRPVDAILTQGRHNIDQWVSSYTLSYSLDGSNWIEYNQVLTGNNNRSTVVKNTLNNPFSARYVRVKPVTFANHVSMRAEILSVSTSKTVTFLAAQTANTTSAKWYAVATGGTAEYTGLVFTKTLATPNTTYYVAAYDPATGCESITRTAVVGTYKASIADQDLNYVITHTLQIPGATNASDIAALSVSQCSQQTTYFDGLGRAMQSVTTQGSPTKLDIVQPIVYDAYGRQEFKYLSYTGGSNGFYKTDAVDPLVDPVKNPTEYVKSLQYKFYQAATGPGSIANDTKPFAQSFLEASPLNRLLEQGAAGEAWQIGVDPITKQPLTTNKTIRILERTNKQAVTTVAALTDDNVRQFTYRFATGDGFGSISTAGYYPAQSLYVTQNTDEHDNKTFVYRNKEGQVLLKKNQISTTPPITDANFAKTYYIYDDMGQLRMVIQPEGSELIPSSGSFTPSAAFMDQWCFTYHYDAKGRMIEKKVPGSGTVVMVYNKRDQLILSQDAKQVASYQWNFTKYDALGRAVLTGLYLTGTVLVSRATMQANADAVATQWETHNVVGGSNYGYTNAAFPTTSTQILSVSFYDDYNFDNSLDLSNDYSFVPGEGVAFTRTLGKATGTKVRVLGTTNASPLTSDFLTSVSFYDQYGRVIQTQSDNYAGGLLGGKETNTSVYDFAGKLLRSKLEHSVNNTLTGITPTTVYKRFEYDHAGRLLSIFQKNNAETVEEKIAQNSYNELGQLKQKKVGQPTSTTAVLQTMDYRYNIRGWLSQVNDAGLSTTSVDNDLFGFELLYNNGTNLSNQNLVGQFNGNIAGQKWQSKQDRVKRMYAYEYDAGNRITKAIYEGYLGTTKQNEQFSLGYDPADPNAANAMTYDYNGNIKSLMQFGLLSRSNSTDAVFGKIDQLTYKYAGTGNRLYSVDDATQTVASSTSRVGGDFADGVKQITPSAEYSYDANGNLVSDANKKILSIVYNHLNLPVYIDFGSSNNIQNVYNASGIKLRSLVSSKQGTDPVIITTTDYASGFVYVNKELQFFPSEEGRVMNAKFTTGGSGFTYEYSYKDHLGNLRLSFREGTTNPYKLTMETSEPTKSNEERAWANVATSRNETDPAPRMFRTGSYSAKVNKDRVLGPWKQIPMNQGDQFSALAYVAFKDTPSGTEKTMSDYLITVGTGPSSPANSGGAESRNSLSALTIGIQAPLNTRPVANSAAPRAYLKYMFYNKDGILVKQASQSAPASANLSSPTNGTWQPLTVSFTAPEDGYVQVFVANEDAIPVWFDDIEAKVTGTMIVQENHYSPWGLNLAGIEKMGNPDNKFQYNGKEKIAELGLNWNDYGARYYDPQLGRWHGVDPLAESYFSFSPYNYVRNNPILRLDPNGNWDITVHAYNDREQYGYGIAIVTDRHGNEVARFEVRLEGTGGRDRMKQNSDTPLGTYDIPDSDSWQSGGSRVSYGPNPRLKLNGQEGEIVDSGRDLIRVHGGRQETYDTKTGKYTPVTNPTLKKTFGCLRCYDSDIKNLKKITDDLEKKDSKEHGGILVIVDDLQKKEDGSYGIPDEEAGFTYDSVRYENPGEDASAEEKQAWFNLINTLLINLVKEGEK